MTPDKCVVLMLSGRPATAGSHVAYARADGKAGVRHDNKRYKAWRSRLKTTALAVFVAQRWEPHAGPVYLGMAYRVARPQSHWLRGRLRPTAPRLPIGQGSTLDVSKVLRAAEDSITGVAWLDDAQITQHRLFKFYSAHSDGRDVGITLWIGGAWQSELDEWAGVTIVEHDQQFLAASGSCESANTPAMRPASKPTETKAAARKPRRKHVEQ